MEPAFQELIDHLEGIEELYKQMLELSGRKQKELVKGNLEQIEVFTKEEENLIYKAGRLEEQRYEHTGRLISHFQLKEDATLKELIEIAPKEAKDKLQTLLESMGQLIFEIDKLNQENISLIQQFLRFINITVDMLSKPNDPATYGMGKEKNQKQDTISRLLDKKI